MPSVARTMTSDLEPETQLLYVGESSDGKETNNWPEDLRRMVAMQL
jgi:hypothetical protein